MTVAVHVYSTLMRSVPFIVHGFLTGTHTGIVICSLSETRTGTHAGIVIRSLSKTRTGTHAGIVIFSLSETRTGTYVDN